jgi:hypothetical protein
LPPGILDTCRPKDVVKHENRALRQEWDRLPKIIQRGSLIVMSVDENVIDGFHTVQYAGQRLVKWAAWTEATSESQSNESVSLAICAKPAPLPE